MQLAETPQHGMQEKWLIFRGSSWNPKTFLYVSLYDRDENISRESSLLSEDREHTNIAVHRSAESAKPQPQLQRAAERESEIETQVWA